MKSVLMAVITILYIVIQISPESHLPNQSKKHLTYHVPVMFQHLSTMPFLRWDNGMSLKEYVFFERAILHIIYAFISNSAFQRRCDLAERREFLFEYNTKHFTSKRYRISLSCVFNRTAFKMKTRLATLNRWS